MKKILCVLLSMVMLFSCLASGVVAADDKEYTEYPVILVSGFGGTALYTTDEETGEEKSLWGNLGGSIGGAVGGNIGQVLSVLGTSIVKDDLDYFVDYIDEGAHNIFGVLSCGPDGKSKVPAYTYVHEAWETNYAYLQEKYPDGENQDEINFMTGMGEKIGFENTYVFTCDMRTGAVQAANELREYIDDVIEYHNQGKAEKDKIDKVNLFAVSQGGQRVGAYIALYGDEGKVNNAVLTIPALAGAHMAYEAFAATAVIDEDTLLEFIEYAMTLEADLHLMAEKERFKVIDEFFEKFMPRLFDIITTWPSFWDFIPMEYYEEMKEKHLDEEINAEIIRQSDFMHYSIIAEDGEYNYKKTFKQAQEKGMNIYIVAGYDNKSVLGMDTNSDAIIGTETSTGATVAPHGKRFADGYAQKVDTGYYQVSPTMTIDASTGFLPQHTWYIENLYHGMTYWDPYARELCYELTLTDKSYDIHNLQGYSQFHATTNPSNTVHVMFDSSKEGYVSSEDSKLIFTNCSNKSRIAVMSADVRGLDIKVDFMPFMLAPGESKEIAFKGEIPAVSRKNFEINVSYLATTITPIGEKTFDFVVMNGDPVAYTETYTDMDFDKEIDSVITESFNSALKNIGIKNPVSVIYNILCRVVYNIINFKDIIMK